MPFSSKQELLTLDAVDIKKHFEGGKLDITRPALEVIRQIKNKNNDALELRALISMTPESTLLQRTKKLGQKQLQRQSRGPLYGIPIVLKI